MQTQVIDFHPSADPAPYVLLPRPASVFAERAERLAALAEGHGLGDWLRFLGLLTRAQHRALEKLPALPLPDAAALERARQHGMPPLNAAALDLPGAWRAVLREIARTLLVDAPPAARAALAALLAAPDDWLDRMAARLLAGEPSAEDAAEQPFIAAALQVVLTALASRLDPGSLQRLDAHGVCPCCGSPPVASIVRLGAEINNLRYLHCALCNSQWNVPRATCTACDTDQGVALLELEGGRGTVRAETCDSCRSYLKIVYQEKDPGVDPVADDLATLALDLLVDEAGYRRSGPNWLLGGGEPEAE